MISLFIPVESSEINNETSSSNNISSTEHVIVTSAGIQISSGDLPGTQKIITTRVVNAKGPQNVLQRPLSMSNVTSFKKPVTSLATGSRNVSLF